MFADMHDERTRWHSSSFGAGTACAPRQYFFAWWIILKRQRLFNSLRPLSTDFPGPTVYVLDHSVPDSPVFLSNPRPTWIYPEFRNIILIQGPCLSFEAAAQ